MATFRTPSKAPQSGGAFLDKPGIFHFQIVHVDEQPTSNGQVLDGFKVQFSVLGGDEDGKSIAQIFFNPNETHSDGGEFASQIQAAFFVGAGLITEADLSKPELDIEPSQAKDHQVVMEVRRKREKVDGKWVEGKFLEVAGPAIYHIDDPRVANVPKKQAAIGLLPKEWRRSSSSFDMVRLTGKAEVKLVGGNGHRDSGEAGSTAKSKSPPGGNGHGNGNGSHVSKPASSPVNVDDL